MFEKRSIQTRLLLCAALFAVLAAATPEDIRLKWQREILWVLIVAFAFAFLLAFAVGANDVANSFGTAVGSKVLTMHQAFTLASVMETSGAILLGSSVGETIRKGIVDPTFYYNDQMCNNYTGYNNENYTQYLCPDRLNNATLLLYGQLSAMLGAASWQIIATLCKLPVSGTHSIVGAIVGFHVAAKGWEGIGWTKMAKIVASWFLSPVLAGILSVTLFWILHIKVLIPSQSDDVIENRKGQRLGLLLLPLFYGATTFVNIYALLHHQEKGGLLDTIPYKSYVSIFGSLFVALIIGVGSYFIFVKSFEKLWFGTEKSKLDLENEKCKNGSEHTDSGYHEKTIQQPGTSKNNNENVKTTVLTKNRSGCFQQANTIPQGPLEVARLLSHIERNDSFASSRGNQSARDLQRLRMTSNKSDGELTRMRINSNGSAVVDPSTGRLARFSESSEVGLTMMSPSRKPTQKAILEDDDGLNEDDLNNEVFEEENPNDLEAMSIVYEKTESENRVDRLFAKLQILTSCFGSFAHGGNDVANAIGPLIAVWLIYQQGGIDIPESIFGVDPNTGTPWFLLLFGGLGITAGLWTCGAKLIIAMGEDITTITPCRGFCIELMSAFTVLGASALGIPVSTTHCKVGSIVAIGIYGKTGIPKKQIINIALAWFVTVPTSALLSAAIMKLLLAIKPI